MTSQYSWYFPVRVLLTNPRWSVIVAFSGSSGRVWTENFWCDFRVKPPFSNSSGEVWTRPEWTAMNCPTSTKQRKSQRTKRRLRVQKTPVLRIISWKSKHIKWLFHYKYSPLFDSEVVARKSPGLATHWASNIEMAEEQEYLWSPEELGTMSKNNLRGITLQWV